MLSHARSMGVLTLILVCTSGCAEDPQVAKREYVRNGDSYVAQQKYREAVVEYRNAIQQDPRFAEARTKLAETYVKLGEPASAFGEYVRAADLLPDDVVAQVKAGQMLLRGRRFEDAKSRAEKALALDRNNTDAHILRANALAGLNDVEGAIQQLEDAIQMRPDHGDSYASLGLMQMARGDKDQAEAAFKMALGRDPRSVKARLALANFYGATARPKEAGEQLLEALKIDPKHLIANRAMATFRLQQGRASEAEPYLKVVADAAPDDAGKLALADYYAATNRAGEARGILESVAASTSGNSQAARLRLAALALRDRNLAEANRFVNEILEKDPKHSDALIAKAQIQTNEKKLDDALVTLRTAAEAAPENARVHLALGGVHLARRDHAAAMAGFAEALKLDPRLIAAEVELAGVHLASGQPDRALQLANSALQKNPGDADALLVRGRALLAQGKTVPAEQMLKPLAAALPNDAKVQAEMGRLQLTKGDRGAARATFAAMLETNPTNIDALTALTRIDLSENKAQQARLRVEDAVRRQPNNPGLLVLAGATYSSLKDHAAAETSLRKAIELDSSNMWAYITLAQLFASQGRVSEATVEYEKAARQQPRSIPIQTAYALLLQMQNRSAEAKAVYQHIVEMDRSAAVASNNLAWLTAEEGGNLDVALELAQAAKAQLPDNPIVNDTLGWVYYKKGLPALAVPPLELAITKDPGVGSYHYHLGLAYAATGNADQARVALGKALSLKPSSEDTKGAQDALARLR